MLASSSRAFPFRPWILFVVATIAVFEFLATFAWRTETGRLFDPAVALVAIPAGAFALLLFAALLLALLARIPLSVSLSAAARFMPLTWSVPLFDIIWSYGNGIAFSSPPLNGGGLLLASLTGGLLPLQSGMPVGVRFGLFAAALILAIAAWHARKSFVRAGIVFFAWSAAAIHLLAPLAAAIFWRNPFAAGAWSASASGIARHIVLLLSQGYWWDGTYERFVTSIASQTDVAARFTAAAILLVALGVLLIATLAARLERGVRLLAYAFASEGIVGFFIAAAIGIVGAFWARVLPSAGAAGTSAILLFILMLVALRFGAVMGRCLFRLAEDERAGIRQPVASGWVVPDAARVFADISAAYALAAAFVLGWPVFAAAGVFLAASRLSRERSSGMPGWLPAVHRALASAALAFATLAFASQRAELSVPVFVITLLAAGEVLFVEFVWLPRMK